MKRSTTVRSVNGDIGDIGDTTATNAKRAALGAFAVGGQVERSALQAHQVSLDERIREVTTRQQRGGRRALFAETVKVAMFLPPDAATRLKSVAAARGTTISALVAEFARRL